MDKIRRLAQELESVLNDSEFKAAYQATNPIGFEPLIDDFWVVLTNGSRAIDPGFKSEDVRENLGCYTIEVGGRGPHCYIIIYRPWQLNLSAPKVTIEQPDDKPYEALADYIEFALTNRFGLPKPSRFVMEQ